MIYNKIFCILFTVAVYWLDFLKGYPTSCSFEVRNEILGKMPLAYTFNASNRAYIIYPEQNGSFRIDNRKKIVLSCVNTTFAIEQFRRFRDVQVTCVQGTRFLYKKQIFDYSELICKTFIKTESKISTTKNCQPNNNTIIEVGYKTRALFFPLYYVCFDTTNLTTLYTWYIVRLPFFGKIQEYKRPEFFVDPIYGDMDVYSVYSFPSQQTVISSSLGLNPNTNTYLDEKYHFLTKGHTIPRTDFYYAREQAATFNFLNAFPHWNEANEAWRIVEKVIRLGMKQNPLSKRVIVTGVYGTYTLPDYQNTQQPLYLVVPQRQIVVPKFVWKMLYYANNPRKSIVFISYNNRTKEVEENVKRDIRCRTKVCPGPITNDVTNTWIEKGIIYCCDIESFQNEYVKFNSDVLTVVSNVVLAPAA